MIKPTASLRDFSTEDMQSIRSGQPVRVWSSILDSWLWWVLNDKVADELLAKGAKVPIYRLSELEVVRGWKPERLREIHEWKVKFGLVIQPLQE